MYKKFWINYLTKLLKENYYLNLTSKNLENEINELHDNLYAYPNTIEHTLLCHKYLHLFYNLLCLYHLKCYSELNNDDTNSTDDLKDFGVGVLGFEIKTDLKLLKEEFL